MENNEKKTFLKYFSAEVGIIIVIIVVILGILLFLGLLPFSLDSIKNSFFSTLPSQGNSLNNTQATTTPTDTGYGCIFNGTFCQAGESIEIKQKDSPSFYALGFANIPSGTPIKATISGSIGIGVTTDPTTSQKISLISIISKDKMNEIDYRFIGKPYVPVAANNGQVTRGEVIGWIGSVPFKLNADNKLYNLVLTLQDKNTKEYTKLKVTDLK